ncbi:ABC transporter ATP-binding protein [Pseudobutyrivibrio xylanivorans]|uniref:ATP-binding cassette, subfamily B n=1 Tax=Pseudobutyrivibrio xylanivorans DSM 14809 TaxID=1123012 RepID=A0A1M6D738_PSEXY|nr:ABC transporter ATP-binding protein [Pseudobutyrivibrio xylanivorans]SHI69045.1 ATP-binding cassette, subfamily B [Pseudobutyrivibrio xylanivorans DSM 14809]
MENKSQSKILNRVLIELKAYDLQILVSVLCALATVVLQLRIPILTGRAVDCIIGPAEIDYDGLIFILKEISLNVVATGFIQWVMNRVNNNITYTITKNFRDRAFAKLQHMKLAEIDSHPHGDFVSRIVADAETFSDGLLMGFTQLFTGVLTILGTIYFMVIISWKIALVVIIATPFSLLLARFISERTYKYFGDQAKLRGDETSYIEEIIINKNIVRNMDYEDRALQNFEDMNNKLADASMRATFYSSTVNPSTRLINNLIYASVGVFGALMSIGGGITVGGLTSFLYYASGYGKPFNEISGVITEFQNALACAERLFVMIDAEVEVNNGNANIDSAKGEIEFKDVSFSYDKSKKLIEHLNLKVEPGKRVAIVGPTGAGKSTIINLLMRFYDIDAGEILIDGTDIRDIDIDNLRRNFGMVLQETWLKNATIKENLKMASPNATDDEIIEAAKATHAHSFIKRMPYGYDTILSPENGSLSQGQMQLLCITRVMLNIPRMLILDEATSSIDTRTEQKIQSAFNKMMKGRTTFVVAHRLSTIREADVILFVKDGQIVEQGNHTELLQKDGYYAKLYRSQIA